MSGQFQGNTLLNLSILIFYLYFSHFIDLAIVCFHTCVQKQSKAEACGRDGHPRFWRQGKALLKPPARCGRCRDNSLRQLEILS